MTKTHCMTRTPTYTTWRKMRERCGNPKAVQWKWYGAKGIAVCERWKNSFESFLADMGERPEGMTLDRIDPSKGYEPGNCRWATHLTQTRGQAKTLRYMGMSLSQYCEENGICFRLVYVRLKRGTPIERAIYPGMLKEIGIAR